MNIEKNGRSNPDTSRENESRVTGIEITLTPAELREKRDRGELEGKIVVVVDVLRATSTLVAALFNGAKDAIVVATVEEARKLKEEMGDEALLCGERWGQLLKDFELGNSPREYTSERVKGKTIILTTSHGAQAMDAAKGAREILVASTLNARAVRDYLAEQGGEVVLAASGSKFENPDGTEWEHPGGREDVTLGCGLVLQGLIGENTKLEQPWLKRLSDLGKGYLKGEVEGGRDGSVKKTITDGLRESLWWQEMLRLDAAEGTNYRGKDLEFIGKETNNFPIVPVVGEDGKLRIKKRYDKER